MVGVKIIPPPIIALYLKYLEQASVPAVELFLIPSQPQRVALENKKASLFEPAFLNMKFYLIKMEALIGCNQSFF